MFRIYGRKYIKKMIRNFCGKQKYQRIWISLYRLALEGMNIGDGGSNDNGEDKILENMRPILGEHPVIFDVGANVGRYTLGVLDRFENADIHCFEPAADTFQILCRKIGNRAVLNNFGLSNEKMDATLYYDRNASTLASLYDRQLDYFNINFDKKETVALDTLDNYCKNNNIAFISLLKMDIEGHELKALQGAKHLLEEDKIGIIQIEFGGCNIDARVYFRDYWNLLSPKFYVYRILKDGLFRIDHYEETLEIFTCTNYLFISKFTTGWQG